MAGSEFTLTCEVSEVISGLGDTPTAIWLNSDGEQVMSDDDGIIIATTPGDGMTITMLTFDPLKTSHDKRYTCRGSISSPAEDDPIVTTAAGDVEVQSKSPQHHNQP